MQDIFDTALSTARRRRAVRRAVDGADFLMRRAADDLGDRLAAVERRFPAAAAIHCSTGHAAAALLESGKADAVLRIEPDGGSDSADLFSRREILPLEPASLDLAVSLFGLGEANDVPGLLVQTLRALRPDGLFLACLAGPGMLAELRDALLTAETEISGGASPRVHPVLDVREAGALLQRAGFALPVSDVETVRVRYDDMFALMRDLRDMGAANALVGRLRRPTRRAVFLRAAEIYAQRFSDPDGRVRATFALTWLSGWAPHGSQQKPARRGSATVSLKSVLGGD